MVGYISFLRGINVSGKNLVKMDKLKEVYESIGFTNVSSYLQSGNIIFDTPVKNQISIAKKISETIKSILGMDVKVIVLSKEELISCFKDNPLIKKDSSNLYFTFLFDKPQEIFLEYLNKFKAKDEEFRIVGRTIYLYCPQGYGKTKLSTNFFEKKLNLNATTRNYNTVKELTELI